jgi:hypothetical protein
MIRSRHSALVLVFGLGVAAPTSAQDAARLWTQKVQTLLDVHCVKCHGPLEQNGELELDTPEAVARGGSDGDVIVPGHPEKSRLYQYLAPDSDPHMPPEKQLTEEQRSVVSEWILALGKGSAEDSGAEDPPPSAEPRVFSSPTEAIDAFIAAGWERRGVTPAPPADDRTWCRRVYLDLAGRVPTADELRAFLYAPGANKRSDLVEQLLASDAFAVRMRELWDVYLMGRGKRDGSEDRRRESGWWTFLEDGFRENRPWNEFVREMLVARPQTPNAKGASWFLYERRDNHQAIAEAVAPIVYGTRIDCAQCHDHPLAREIKQAHYWGLVAAFNRSKNVGDSSEVEESAVGGFVNFTNLQKESQPAKVALLTGGVVDEAWPADGDKQEDRDDNYVDPQAKVKVPKFSRRAAFAERATADNSLLARAFVNRMWATLVGRGIVHPVDEMNDRNVPSHPELLAWLADDFATHQYDVRRMVGAIVLSRVYGLAPVAEYASADQSAPPEAFARALERPLTAEQIARSWRMACGLPPDDDALRREVIAAMPDVMPRDYNATFQQAQFLAESRELVKLLEPAPGNTVERLAQIEDDQSRVREAFMAVFQRWPDSEEQVQSLAFLAAQADSPNGGVGDLLWALVTSAEFLTTP